MEPTDRLTEENIGTVAMIRKRAETLLDLAEGCDTEAREQTESAARLRARAVRLREQALEYRYAAHSLEQAPPDALPHGAPL